MVTLAIDNALKVSGYAIFDGQKLIKYGTFKTNDSAPIEHRLGEIWGYITDLYAEYEFNYLVFEDCQQQANPQTYHKLSMVKATILLWIYFNGIKYNIYGPSHWRKILGYSFGTNRAEQKQKAIDIVKENYKVEVKSDEADAILIGMAALKESRSAF